MKRTLVIIPSPLIRTSTYEPLVREASKVFEVVIFDLPESGSNKTDQRVWTTSDYAAWVEDELARRMIVKPVLLGHSNSGAIAIKLAIKDPEILSAVILADSIGVEKQSLVKIALGRLVDSVIELTFTIRATPHILSNFSKYPRNVIKQIQLAGSEQLDNEIRSIHIPVVIAWGELDFTMPKSILANLEDLLPEAIVLKCKRGSHDWIVTHSREFIEKLKAVL